MLATKDTTYNEVKIAIDSLVQKHINRGDLEALDASLTKATDGLTNQNQVELALSSLSDPVVRDYLMGAYPLASNFNYKEAIDFAIDLASEATYYRVDLTLNQSSALSVIKALYQYCDGDLYHARLAIKFVLEANPEYDLALIFLSHFENDAYKLPIDQMIKDLEPTIKVTLESTSTITLEGVKS